MSNILLVPVHLDALVLDHDQMVVEATADFSRLPFFTGKRDINPDIANVSEEIVSTPFQNQNLLLKKGVHLHWSLPDALTRARYNPESPEKQDFPRVPNRWLVTRCNKSGKVEKTWLIESDFLHPAADGSLAGSGVTIPYRKDQAQPFRYMGRTMELSAAQGREQGEYYPKLTAVGYGEPSFAAFYPNCYSVFGFHDPDYPETPDERRYYVTGWYSKVEEDVLMTHVRDALLFRPNDFTKLASFAGKLRAHADPLTQYLHAQLSATTQSQLNRSAASDDVPEELRKNLIDDLNRLLKAGPLYRDDRFARVALTPETKAYVARTLEAHEDVRRNRVLLEEAFPEEIMQRSPTLPRILEDSFKWTYVRSNDYAFPFRLICYARLIVGERAMAAQPDEEATVAVGNTGTEALSACLAQKLCGNAPDDIVEDQLEALHLAATLEHRQLDVAAKFVEGRHEKGFAAVAGGTIWTVRAYAKVDSPAEADDAPSGITLPDELGQLLNTVNERQAAYDRAWQQIESLRIQLFSDWYKYMLCAYPPEGAREAYPDIDEVQSYIDFRTASLNQKIVRAGTLVLNDARGGVVATVAAGANSNGGGSPATLAAALAQSINELQKFIISHADAASDTTYRLKQTSGPRYWQPTEPSVLIDGAIADPSNRHGNDGRPSDGLLVTHILPNAAMQTDLTLEAFRNALRERINTIGGGPDKNFAFTTWNAQPWNPFLLEWDVEVFPIEHKSNINPTTGHYDEDFITANYQLLENDVDLSLRPKRGAWTLAANVYSGRSILTPHATQQLTLQAESYIEKEVLPQYLSSKNGLRREEGRSFLAAHMKGMQDWYQKKSKLLLGEANGEVDPTMTAFRAWGEMREPECLSQSLSGFNEALLMHKQTLQLHVADPLGFSDYKPFADRVQHGVNESIYSAPAPLNDFNPIRSGMLKIHRLRLIDTFGQIKDLKVNKIVTSDPLDDGSDDPLISLPPRLTQPARVNFRWLSADADQEEMNDHPATTPICGWVLANNLDNSLMIYDNSGRSLGSLVKKDGRPPRSEWVRAPGGLGVAFVKDISNRHLRKMVTTIQTLGADFLDDFISAIDSAVENIEPENFVHHQDLALLMGRPLALVRASISLELKGLPASHQGWNEFRQDLQRDDRDDNGFSRVRFPIRIGEYKQFNDGTVGYWKENGDEYEGDTFFAPQSDEDVKVRSNHLKTHLTHPEEMVFFQTVEAEPQILSLLIDPRGVVHATTGIVPVKGINIPPDQYGAALQAIEITFLSAPIITDAGKIHLPLPDEAGYQWSWLQQDVKHVWSEVSSRGLVRKESFAVFGDRATAVWDDLLQQGWIKLLDEKDKTRASVVAKDKRDKPSLSDGVIDKTVEIEDILDRAHIGPVDPAAKFSGPQEIREGWLKLSNVPAEQSSNTSRR